MDVGDAVLAAMDRAFPLGEPVSPASTDRGLHARMRALEGQHGSGPKAARALGVSPETWRRWKMPAAKGKKPQRPTGANLDKVTGAARKLYRTARRGAANRRLRHVASTVSAIIRWEKYYNRIPYRDVNFEPADLRPLIEPWLNRDAAAAGEAFERAVSAAQGLEYDPADYNVGVRIEGEDVHVTIHA